MAEKPVIGVMPLYDEKMDSIWMLPGYLNGIYDAGAIPIILPMNLKKDEVNKIDSFCYGYLFTGGQDIDPMLYGEKNRGNCGFICNERDSMEKLIFDTAYKNDKPILGVCRGLQIINAFLGGTLYQDLPSERPTDICHSMKPPYDSTIEAVEDKSKKFLWAVQWHPEFLYKSDDNSFKILKKFIDECKRG